MSEREYMQLLQSLRGSISPLEYSLLSAGIVPERSTVSRLPHGSTRKNSAEYEEVSIPATATQPFDADEELISIETLPSFAQRAFYGIKTLNRIQSRLSNAALKTDNNLLLCAPTGAGKTNVALLAILREVGKNVKPDDTVDIAKFKVVYVAPLKSLAQEMVRHFRERLAPYGMRVEELTGDNQLTKSQIMATQVIVCTPEKWDIITRKGGDGAHDYTRLVRLIIIDEVHLLNDDRGPVLEAIVARTIRKVETTTEEVRLVALSAMLPNYADIASFLRVDPEQGLFHFNDAFRPVPLQQQYIGIKSKRHSKRTDTMNELIYDKIANRADQTQVLIFVHSRRDTGKTATAIMENALIMNTIDQFVAKESQQKSVLERTAKSVTNRELKELLPYAFAMHNAGMSRNDRALVESLFSAGHIKVLVSTSTLAWGVNLPAHTVIIKGTKVFNPEKGGWMDLDAMDISQMLGRAGRPQYDTKGEGIVLTNYSELEHYISLMTYQVPIESQFQAKLPDNLNAEIVLGTVQNITDAVAWLGYTFFYVRMTNSPTRYGLVPGQLRSDEHLVRHRTNLIRTAATLLHRHLLTIYDSVSGSFEVTELGRIASHFYITHETIAMFNVKLNPLLSSAELLHVFSLSAEFNYIRAREDEITELQKLLKTASYPIKEGINTPGTKVNILLQAYMFHRNVEGSALLSEMGFIAQCAARIMRALQKIITLHGWTELATKAEDFCNIIDSKMYGRTWYQPPQPVVSLSEAFKDLTVKN